jgi:hypothetical protein
MAKAKERRESFTLRVLGRTLELLGLQMYKRREAAIAELVANCWDAGAKRALIEVPDPKDYDAKKSTIVISDDGSGMTTRQIRGDYLVVSRNRRRGGVDKFADRPVMGRKGIGKLAGFGVAEKMTIRTWRDGEGTVFALDIHDIKADDDIRDVAIKGRVRPHTDKADPHGTQVILEGLKPPTPIDVERLLESLARRFARRVKGEMEMVINRAGVGEPTIDLDYRVPKEGFLEHKLSTGRIVQYYYAFATKPITYKEMRGFTIFVRGKTAQAPPFFFFVETTASGQHGTRYVSGAIEADFLDEGTDDESDWRAADQRCFIRTGGPPVRACYVREKPTVRRALTADPSTPKSTIQDR